MQLNTSLYVGLSRSLRGLLKSKHKHGVKKAFLPPPPLPERDAFMLKKINRGFLAGCNSFCKIPSTAVKQNACKLQAAVAALTMGGEGGGVGGGVGGGWTFIFIYFYNLALLS